MSRRSARRAQRSGSTSSLVVAGLVGAVAAAALVTWRLGGNAAASGAVGFLTALIAAGFYLWFSAADRAKSKGEIGRGLLISGIIGVAFAWIQFDVSEYQRRTDHERDVAAARSAERQSLQLTVGLQRDLTGIDLSHRDIHRFYFRGKVLRDAQLIGARANDANFTSADLRDADLRDGQFRRASFDQADMRRSTFDRADFRRAEFFTDGLERVSATFAAIGGDSAAREAQVLRSAGVKLGSAVGEGADFQGASLPWATLTSSQLAGASFRRADLHGALLIGTDLRSTDMRDADLSGAVLVAANLRGASLAGTRLAGAIFDCHTRWPAGFDTTAAGLTKARADNGCR